MDLSGKIISVLDAQSFNKKDGSVLMKYGFVIETSGTQYPKKAVMYVFGEDRWKQMGIAKGGVYQVSFDIDAREWNGRWYNEVTAWRAQCIEAPKQGEPRQAAKKESPKPAAESAPAQSQQTEADVLPF